jgi:hypothetical protein
VKRYALVALAAAACLIPATRPAAANTATSQTVVSMNITGSSCTLSSNGSDPSFGTLSNPITAEQSTSGSFYISCGGSSPALKISFNDASNTGTANFTMTNSTTTTATQTYQICDGTQFTGTTCPNGFQYKNTTAFSLALPSNGTQSYSFVPYFIPGAGGINLTGGSYFDTLTATITF